MTDYKERAREIVRKLFKLDATKPENLPPGFADVNFDMISTDISEVTSGIEQALHQVRREALEEIADKLAFKFEDQIGPINAVIAWIRLWAKDPGKD